MVTTEASRFCARGGEVLSAMARLSHPRGRGHGACGQTEPVSFLPEVQAGAGNLPRTVSYWPPAGESPATAVCRRLLRQRSLRAVWVHGSELLLQGVSPGSRSLTRQTSLGQHAHACGESSPWCSSHGVCSRQCSSAGHVEWSSPGLGAAGSREGASSALARRRCSRDEVRHCFGSRSPMIAYQHSPISS